MMLYTVKKLGENSTIFSYSEDGIIKDTIINKDLRRALNLYEIIDEDTFNLILKEVKFTNE